MMSTMSFLFLPGAYFSWLAGVPSLRFPILSFWGIWSLVGLPTKGRYGLLLIFTIRRSDAKGATEGPQGCTPIPISWTGRLSLPSASISHRLHLFPVTSGGGLGFWFVDILSWHLREGGILCTIDSTKSAQTHRELENQSGSSLG